ncbi:MAG: hypothetical protein ABI861_14355 [Panacibacter sp.]
MRTIHVITGIVLLLTACTQKPSTESSVPVAATDIAQDNLKGNVQQLESDTYLVDSTGKDSIDSKNIEVFDDKGYAASITNKNGKDSVLSETSYTHNANGFLTNLSGKANGKTTFSLTLEYDSTGKYMMVKTYDSTGKMDSYYTDITSNAFGQPTGGKNYHADSTLKMSFVTEYDSIYFVGSNSTDSTGKVVYSSKVKLNDKKDAAELNEMSVTPDPKTKKDSTKNTVTTYTYDGWDSHGNWTQQTSLNEKGKPTKLIKRIIMYKD